MALNFWDTAPKPSFLSFIRGILFGPSPCDVAVPPKRLDGVSGTASGTAPKGLLPAAHVKTPQEVHEYCTFLAQNFSRGNSGGDACGYKPQYLPDMSGIISEIENGTLRPLIVRSSSGGGKAVKGCIASHEIGQLRRNAEQEATPFKVRIIKDFCVSPDWRKRGLGSYLLHSVWNDLRPRGEDAVIFLKEGAALGSAGPAIWSSRWIYRRMREVENVTKVRKVPWTHLPQLLKLYTAGRTDYIFNILGRTPSHSVALEYTTFRGAVLASFTRAYQQHPTDGEWICYQTGWIEKGEMTGAERDDAALQISAAAAAILGCYWVWADKGITGERGSSGGAWTDDGPYHWYAFHWTPGFYEKVRLWLAF